MKRVFNAHNPRIPLPWIYGEEVEAVRIIGHLDQPWLVLLKDGEKTGIGLAVSVWHRYWERGEIDVERSKDNVWVPVGDRDWGEFANETTRT